MIKYRSTTRPAHLIEKGDLIKGDYQGVRRGVPVEGIGHTEANTVQLYGSFTFRTGPKADRTLLVAQHHDAVQVFYVDETP